jgi:predicted DNA-binding transcriptional regulator YafY
MRASRLVAMLLLLQVRGRMTAAELAKELAVSVRTVQRDAEALGEAGIPVYSERGRAGGYRLVSGYSSRLTGLARDEARALLAVGTAGPAGELGFGQALLSARLKLAASLPAGLRQEVAAAAGRFHLDAPGWFTARRPVPFLEALAAGVFGDLAVRARYRGRSGSRDCLLEPLGLVLKAGAWYLVAREGPVVRGYRADRFQDAAVTGHTFTRPGGFDLAAFWAGWREEFEHGLARVSVTVRARPGCTRRLRRVVEPAHAGEVCWDTVPEPDGWVRLRLPFEKLEYARAALLGFGADVEVLEPEELRRQMIETAGALSALYTGPSAMDCPV